jgi:iron complex outermembrane receptor protein
VHRKSIYLACVAGLAILPAAAFAADAEAPQRADSNVLEEVVVTATKTGETAVQRTPIAISAFNANSLSEAGLVNVKDLNGYVPNLSISQSTTYAEIFIRGIGSTNVYGGSDPSVTVQVDGVYLGRPYAQFAEFLDVDRVEVLRGPQGTLYGRNAVGGTINVVSKIPTDTFHAQAEVQTGNYSLFDGKAYVSGPIVAGKLDGSLAVSYTRHDDYIKNIIASGNDIENANHGGVRGQLRFTPSDNISLTTRADYSRAKEHTESYSKLLAPFDPVTDSILGDYSKVAMNLPNNDDVRTWGVAEDIDVDLGGGLSLRSITAYRNNRNRVDIDSDDSEQSITSVHQGEDQDQFSTEANLVGKLDRLTFVLGGYYLHENVDTDVRVNVFGAGVAKQFLPQTSTDAIAGFAQATYNVTDTVSVTAGARYTSEKKSIDQQINLFLLPDTPLGAPAIFGADRTFNAFTPKFSVQWQPNENVLAYVSATRGFKSGGFNFSATSADTAGFDPETVWSYEAGTKTEWFGRRLRVNLTGFIYDYSNLQQFLATAPGVAIIANAATAKVKGVELEVVARPGAGIELGANLAYLHAVYTNYPDAPVPQSLGPFSVDATGKRLDNAPPYSVSLFAKKSWAVSTDKTAFIRGEYLWLDKQYGEPTNYALQALPAYGVVNLTAGLISDKGWEVDLWARNLTDKQYLLGTQDAGATFSGMPGPPRTFGVRLAVKYD